MLQAIHVTHYEHSLGLLYHLRRAGLPRESKALRCKVCGVQLIQRPRWSKQLVYCKEHA